MVRVPEMPGREFHGAVARIAEALQPGTRTLRTEIDVPNPKHVLSPGTYCTVELKIPQKTPSLIVPSEAIIFNREGLNVAVVENGVARIHRVTVVRDFGTTVEVSAGIKEGDQVVLNPPVDLTDGHKVSTACAPRAHPARKSRPSGANRSIRLSRAGECHPPTSRHVGEACVRSVLKERARRNRSPKKTSLAEFFDQRIGDRIGFHCGGLADAKDVPVALPAGDLVGVPTSDDMELALLRRHPHRCERDRRVDIAQDEVGVIAIDQLSGFCNADGNFICRSLTSNCTCRPRMPPLRSTSAAASSAPATSALARCA